MKEQPMKEPKMKEQKMKKSKKNMPESYTVKYDKVVIEESDPEAKKT